MSPDFKAEEEEVDLWFDEEKEKFTNEYFKKVDFFRPKEGEDEEEAKKRGKYNEDLSLNYKDDFLAHMKKVRDGYDARYNHYVRKKETYTLKQKIIGIVMKPIMFIWNIIKKVSIFIYSKALYPFIFRPVIISYKTTIKFFKDIKYYSKQGYTFHLKDILFPITWPFHMITTRIRRVISKITNAYTNAKKGTIKFAIDTGKKIWDKTTDIAKKFWEIFMKHYTKVAAIVVKVFKVIAWIYNKIIHPLLKPIFFVFGLLGKIFSRGESDDEE